MTLKATNKLVVKGTFGTRTMEILRLTKHGIDARDVKESGQSVLMTGFTFYGINVFWEMVKAGAIQIV